MKLVTDGGSRPNPGPGAIGVIVLDENNDELESHRECIGHTTNNRAEYRALIKGLNLCAKHTRGEVSVFMDSEVVLRQLSGTYRLINDELRSLFLETKQLESMFTRVTYTHVPRDNSLVRRADRLVNEARAGR